jgi:O-antigen ligase
MLFLAFSSLLIAIRWKINRWHQILCGIAFFCGIYMSIKSGSRTGWLAIPIVCLYMLYIFEKIKILWLLAAAIFIVFCGLFLYFINTTFHSRIDDFLNGFINYTWTGNPSANDSSIGVRLSMLRMGWHAFTEAPWFGFGSENIYNIINTDSIRNYATESTIKFSSDGFMHNEFVTQLVKHGIFGGLAYLFILYTIVRIFIKSIRLKIKSPMIDVFVIYILFAVVASLSTEILIVKPMILFFGFMLACFAGEALWRIQDAEAEARVSPSGSSRIV